MQPMNGAMFVPLDDWPLLIPMALGVLVAVVASIRLLIQAFRVHVGWGLAVFFIPLLGPFAFLAAHFRKALWPLVLFLFACLLIAAPAGYMALKGKEIARDAVVQTVPARDNASTSDDGPEQRIALTGAKREDYAQLKANKNFAVVQWSNADVTDADTELLHGMGKLRELDLNGTAITDDALHVLEDMPKLEILRVARTAITEAGFKEHIEPIETLMELDVRGTKVPAKLAREWKAAKPGRKLLI